MVTEAQIETFLNLYKLVHEETQFQRIPLEAENNMLDRIRQGDYKNFSVAQFDRIVENVGISSVLDPMSSYTYSVVSAITMFARIAIEEGVIPDDAFDLSDVLLCYLHRCQTLEEVHHIFELSGKMFAKQIAQVKETSQSWQVERILNYISRNIYKKITLEEIAEYMNLSSNYISRIFSKEMHISIHNYIQREKTQLACNLLKHTDRSISDIALYLGFQTPSNFTTVFRKWQQISPSEYRAQNYKEVF